MGPLTQLWAMLMKRIILREYERSEPLELPADLLRGLYLLAPGLRIEPARESAYRFEITPDSHVGVIRIGDSQFDIRPKIPMDRFFFILSYGVDPSLWREQHVLFDDDDTVLEAVAPAFCKLVARATYRGLLHGYRTEEQTLPLVRGQIRFAEQLRRHHGRMLPVELRFDEFTEDIVENRILLAALDRLRRLPLRSIQVQRGLNEIMSAFHGVSSTQFHPLEIPEITFTRLNKHYEPAVNLARLILKSASLEFGQGNVVGTSLLVDMNDLFEVFVHRALREELRLSESQFPRAASSLRLDTENRIRLKPDLSWWHGGRCCFVGDVKYKRVTAPGIRHPDLYQLLAYTVASNLPAGMLVYAAHEGEPARHRTQHAGKTLFVEALDLTGSPEQILGAIRRIADRIRMLVAETRMPNQCFGRFADTRSEVVQNLPR